MIHRDVKLENIFLHGKMVVIGDFGFAVKGAKNNVKLGTPQTMAPEILTEKEIDYDSKVDLWSIGVIFYQLLFGVYPFVGVSYKEILREIKKKSGLNLEFPKEIRIETKHLLINLL